MSIPSPIALFVTCLVDQFLPEVGVAAVRLLRRAGCQVDCPAAQTCCGQPFYNSGFQSQAAELARRTIALLEPYPVVVVPGGSCATMLSLEYVHLLADDPAWLPRAQALAARTYELSAFLVRFLPDLTDPHTGSLASRAVTYHDSCHMCRALGLREPPRQLLQAAGYVLHEMTEADRCCGFGGLFAWRLPELSAAMGAEKLRQAQAANVTHLITADPGCLLHLRSLAGDDCHIEHLATALAAAIT